MEDKSRENDPHMDFLFGDKTVLQSIRFRHFMRDCRALAADRAELDVFVARERQALGEFMESSCRDILANFDPRVVVLRKKTKIVVADGALNDLL